jgi:hypothetical protein
MMSYLLPSNGFLVVTIVRQLARSKGSLLNDVMSVAQQWLYMAQY